MISPRLLRAYRRTRYRAGTEIEVRVGHRSPGIDALLRQHRARHAVFLTAWNPFSRPMPRGWNERMQRRLTAHLRRHKHMEAVGELDHWREIHVLVLTDQSPMIRLAQLFRQNAVVCVHRCAPARIVLLR